MKEQCSEISFFYGEGMAITGRDPLTASTVISFMLGWVRPLYPPTQKTAGVARGAPLTSSW
jgi:hypothetical protein